MIYLLHGESTVASRTELGQLREKFKNHEVVIFDGKTVTPTQLLQATQSTSLFGTNRLVVVENLFSKRLAKKSTDIVDFAYVLSQLDTSQEIIFWEEKELGKKMLELLPAKTDRALFRPDRSLFAFVDGLKPGDGRHMLPLFERTLEKDAPEIVFALLVRQCRLLLMVKNGQTPEELAPWQTRKFHLQATHFTLPQLLALYKRLFEIDVKIKTGGTPFTLREELQTLLATL